METTAPDQPPAAAAHFPGCHPEDAEAPETPGHQQQETEECWHCGTPVTRGCNCTACWDSADDVPPGAVYHCQTCRRWWAYMHLNVTRITFGEAQP
jgi:hypothetical protein